MPQIELMQSDLPHTLYQKKGRVSKEDLDEVTRLQEEANRRAAERRKAREAEEYTVDELFNGRLEMEEEQE